MHLHFDNQNNRFDCSENSFAVLHKKTTQSKYFQAVQVSAIREINQNDRGCVPTARDHASGDALFCHKAHFN